MCVYVVCVCVCKRVYMLSRSDNAQRIITQGDRETESQRDRESERQKEDQISKRLLNGAIVGGAILVSLSLIYYTIQNGRRKSAGEEASVLVRELPGPP